MATDGGKFFGFMTVTIEFATRSAEPFTYMNCLYIRKPYRGIGFYQRMGARAMAKIRFCYEIDTQEAAC